MGNNSANNKTTSPPTEVNAADWPSIEAADVPPSETSSADWSSVEPPEVPPPEVVDDSPSPSKMALEEAEKQPNERKDNCVVREECCPMCTQTLSVKNVKKIINTVTLFTSSNCPLPANQKTIKKFTDELNVVLKKYNINSCLRRIHFFAQMIVESGRFKTTLEYTAGNNWYSPFDGRGLKQITHDYNYLEYYDYVKGTNYFSIYQKYNKGRGKPVKNFIGKDPALTKKFYTDLEKFSITLANDLSVAFDSAGWYWQKMKINFYADKDKGDMVSKKVNLPYGKLSNVNGLKDRRKEVKRLKDVFDYVNCK